jgi:hypothetical protein
MTGGEEVDEQMTAGHAVTVETTKGKGRVRPRQKVMEAARRMGTTVPPVIPRLTGACLPMHGRRPQRTAPMLAGQPA